MLLVREEDCGTDEGIEVEDFKDGNELIEDLYHDRIVGRYSFRRYSSILKQEK
jgi:DNA-directed RNA polymerase subunit beta'